MGITSTSVDVGYRYFNSFQPYGGYERRCQQGHQYSSIFDQLAQERSRNLHSRFNYVFQTL